MRKARVNCKIFLSQETDWIGELMGRRFPIVGNVWTGFWKFLRNVDEQAFLRRNHMGFGVDMYFPEF